MLVPPRCMRSCCRWDWSTIIWKVVSFDMSDREKEDKRVAEKKAHIDFVQDHVDRYRRTNGEDGHEFAGGVVMLVDITGRKSGIRRTVPVMYARDGDTYLTAGSRGGAKEHPQWFLNLVANPDVTVQVMAEVFDATAVVVPESPERDRQWKLLVEAFPQYAEYQTKTDRVIPVIRFERNKRQ